ncbi:MAG: hypothetical protein CM1200mP39_22280 [Dehalococcoidia bacterium]|nr:MAG: hypothetical protein CM1200mP39_22280 [Dehalococcoidia bacterium]
MDRLAHKVAIVTGSGTRSTNVTGVGMATAKLFASHGASVLIVDMNESAAKSLKRRFMMRGKGFNFHWRCSRRISM